MQERKKNRLSGYDYSLPGVYFVTVCVQDKSCILGQIPVVGERIALPPKGIELSSIGIVVKEAIENISCHYSSILVDQYVIMPNHIHAILVVENRGSAMRSPTISTVVNQMKGFVTKRVGFSIWQRSFHDHIIHTRREYEKIRLYIETNPQNWQADCFYTP